MKKSNKRKKPEDLMVRAGPSSDSTNSARLPVNLPNETCKPELKMKIDKRRQWLVSETEELMYCYYSAKAQGRGYLKRLEEMMKQRYAGNNRIQKYTGSMLATQCRYIEDSNILTKEKLQELKRKAEQDNDPISNQQQEEMEQNNQQQEEMEQNNQQQEEVQTKRTELLCEEEEERILQKFQENITKVKGMTIESRKPLPKAKINKKFESNLEIINQQIKKQITPETNITEINEIIYAAAVTVTEENGQELIKENNNNKNRKPKWEIRLNKKLERKRKELTQITNQQQEKKGEVILLEEQLKQEVKAIAGRIRRYKDNEERRKQNQMFNGNEKLFYRKYLNQSVKVSQLPEKEEIEKFWKNILENEPSINETPQWIQGIEKKAMKIENSIFSGITLEKLKESIIKTQNWKATGIDRVHNYYIKKLSATHNSILKCYNSIIMGEEEVPEWMTIGRVILIPKNEHTENPKNWRPIACLPTMYKILTAVISEEISEHCNKNNIITDYQRGCKKGARGCQDHLLLNRYILEDASKNNKNLSMAWIDYQKAFDSIPHKWLLKTLKLYKIPPKLIDIIEKLMKKWRLRMTAYGESDLVTTGPIEVKRGIFQGDSLSPLLFCIGLNPLSQALEEDKVNGYKTKGEQFVNHLLYMDDIKIYTKNEKSLNQLLKKIETITNDIGMEFGLDKCKTIHLKKGKQQNTQGRGHILMSGKMMEELGIDQDYKYLGIKENGKINHALLKKELSEEYIKRVRKILKTKLNSNNIIAAINRQAVPVLTYSFLAIKWKEKEIEALDIKTRRMLTIFGCHQAKADKDRLYEKPENGGRGLTNIKDLYVRAVIGYAKYMNEKEDQVVSKIQKLDKYNIKYSASREAEKYQHELQVSEQDKNDKIRKRQEELNEARWQAKKMHGQFKNLIEEEFVDKKQSFVWTKKTTIAPRVHAQITAIQDQCVKTRYYEKRITKRGENEKCRRCRKDPETIHHIAGGCEELAKKEYIERHDNIVKYVHWNLAKENNFEIPKQWWKWELKEKQILENEEVKILWEVPVRTDKKINANRPDIILINKQEKTVKLIDITVPQDYNIQKKEKVKKDHYQDLKIEVQRLWKMKTEVVPIVIGCTGVVAKTLKKYVKKISNKINIAVMQKQAAINTAIIVSSVLSTE